jgi:hypothetical protein
MFEIRPLSGDNYYKLIIGAEGNEKVQLFYGVGEGKTTDSFQIDIMQFYLKKD